MSATTTQTEQLVQEEVAVAHAEPTTGVILRNVAAQMFNIALFLFIFVKFFGGKILQSLTERKEAVLKIAHASEATAQIIADAQSQAQTIVHQAHADKVRIEQEAQMLAKRKADEILQQAEQKWASIVADLQQQLTHQKDSFMQEYETLLKQGIFSATKKLIGQDPVLKEQYIDTIIKELPSMKA